MFNTIRKSSANGFGIFQKYALKLKKKKKEIERKKSFFGYISEIVEKPSNKLIYKKIARLFFSIKRAFTIIL